MIVLCTVRWQPLVLIHISTNSRGKRFFPRPLRWGLAPKPVPASGPVIFFRLTPTHVVGEMRRHYGGATVVLRIWTPRWSGRLTAAYICH